MIGIHDTGGHHYGPIDTVDEKVFHEQWEALTFGLLFVCAIKGSWALDEFRHSIENMGSAYYLTSAYYEHWLEALEELGQRDGFFTKEELVARQKAIRENTQISLPSGEPDISVVQHLKESARNIAYVGLGARRPDAPQNYLVGDQIRARSRAVRGHTRLPRFVWGKRGVIVSYSGTYPYADTVAHRLGENPEPTYAVRFDGRELWGPEAEPNTSVTMDLFESYMDLDRSEIAA